jgi:hypothetical protein
MNNIVKTELLTLVFTVIAIGFFGISTAPMVYDVFAEKHQQGKNSNTDGNTATDSSPNKGNEECTPWDPRC